jgi:hypothetical protein
MIQHQNPETIVIKTPFDKIGTFLGISTPTVSSIYRKALKKNKKFTRIKKNFYRINFFTSKSVKEQRYE